MDVDRRVTAGLLPSVRPGGMPGDVARAAREVEASFLAEMLRHAGFARTPETLGGGAGERQMSGFLIQEVAADIARHRPLGIAAMVEAGLAREGTP